MRAGRDSFPFKQSAMSVQSKRGLIAGVCALAPKSQGIPPKCYSKGQESRTRLDSSRIKEALFIFQCTFFF